MIKSRLRHFFGIGPLLVLLGVLGGPFSSVEPISPDYTNMGRLLETNRMNITFLDNAVSNMPLASDQDKAFREEMTKLFQSALRHDFYAHLWFLQGNYSRTYTELVASQDDLQNIYRRVLENYIDATWVLLESSAPLIVRTRDAQARHMLQLGFRDLESARQFHTSGISIKPTLHNNQMDFFRDGIKRIRRARRYGVMALIEAKLPKDEKSDYQQVTLDDIKNAEEDGKASENHYEKVLNLLINLMGRKLIPAEVGSDARGRPIQLKLLEVHQDNYNRLISDRRSLWHEIVAELKTDEFHAKEVLPKRNRENKDTIPASDSDPEHKPEPTTKPGEKKPGETKPADNTKPGNTQPGNNQPGNNQPKPGGN